MFEKRKRDLSGFINTFGKSEIAENIEIPKIKTALPQNQEPGIHRFGSNKRLLFSLDAAFRVFDASSKPANLFFSALLARGEKCARTGKEMIIFNQPSIDAYKSELKLCAALESHDNLQATFDEFIGTHTLGVPLGEWMQAKDSPLLEVRIYAGDKEIEFSICNTIQAAILCGYYSAKNPDIKHEIKKA